MKLYARAKYFVAKVFATSKFQLFNERLLRTTLALLVGGNPNATM